MLVGPYQIAKLVGMPIFGKNLQYRTPGVRAYGDKSKRLILEVPDDVKIKPAIGKRITDVAAEWLEARWTLANRRKPKRKLAHRR